MDALFDALTLTTGISWTIVYLAIINRGFKDKTYGMPLLALALNITWEFIYSFLFHGGFSPQVAINMAWFFFDVIILYTYLRYGRAEFPKTVAQKWFVPWTWLGIAVAFAAQYTVAVEFPGVLGATYSAFAGNLVMSILFIRMLFRRNGVEGQSMGIAIFKWLGTVAATALLYLDTNSNLILALGILIFGFDALYAGLLYRKFRALGLDPFTRKPLGQTTPTFSESVR